MEKIYQLLFEAGDYTKSFEEFVQQYGSVEKSKPLYKGLNDVGDYTKSFEEFTSQYGFSDEVKKKTNLSIPLGKRKIRVALHQFKKHQIPYWNLEIPLRIFKK